ncbi:MAG TPA: glycosyltransferase [Chitinophagales bacterium]|nr:glycosyltransferase [Chitinophagales bacterium]
MITYSLIVLSLTLCYVFLFLFYLTGWVLLAEYQRSARTSSTRVSIIVAARNEEVNIGNLLNDLLKQNFSSELFEVIVVDDFSEDRTAEIVSSFQNKNLRLLQLENFLKTDEPISSFKKKALEMGIQNATGELIVTTDADCRMNNNWLHTLVNFFEEHQCKMIVAPVLMRAQENFFQKFQTLDLIGLTGITGATLHLNFPTMCNGANLAFTKKSFYEVDGYRGISEKTSGDDMLLMHKMARQWKRGVLFLKNKDAAVFTEPQPSLSSFIRQRMRWTSKSKVYEDPKIILNLIAVLLFNFSLLVSLILSFFDHELLMVFLIQFITKAIMDFAFLSQVTKFFRRQQLLWLFLPAEILHIIYIVIAGIAGNFFTVKWKERIVK